MRRSILDYRSMVLADAPVGYWRLGEASGNAADSSGFGNTGTASGAIVYGVPGAILDGTSGVTLSSTAMFFTLASTFQFATNIPGQPFTIEAWVKFTSTLQQMVFSNRFGSTGVYFGVATGKVFCYLHNGALGLTAPTALNNNAWHHIVMTWDGVTRTMYLDGQFEVKDTPALTYGPPSTGASLCDDINGGDFWDGSIDEVAVYAKALSAGQVLRHYQAAFVRGGSRSPYALTVKQDRPTAYWRLDDLGATTTDIVGGNVATYTGGVTKAVPGALVDGNPAVGLDGISGFLQASTLAPLTGAALRTVEFWFKTNSNKQGLFSSSGTVALGQAFELAIVRSPDITWGVPPVTSIPSLYFSANGSDVFLPAALTLADGAWHHMAIAFDSSTLCRIYIDGQQPQGAIWNGVAWGGLGAQPFTLPTALNTTGSPIWMGQTRTPVLAQWLSGSLDELAIYPYALSAAQILSHYNLARAPVRVAA